MAPILEFHSVTKAFKTQSVLQDIAFRVERGEFFTLLGPSGSGKTTLLRLAAGFEQPDSGVIFLDGINVTQSPPNKRRVNTVFQSYALFPHLDVSENIAFGLKNLKVPKSTIRSRISAIVDLVRLNGHEARFPHQLSGGQQQRVALARALVMEPLVLLLDEPLGALDQALRQEMQLELKSLQKRLDLSFVFVTHDQQEALSLSDRVMLLHHGRAEQVSPPEELYHFPRSKFAAEFMGVENLLAIRTVCRNGEAIDGELEEGGRFSAAGKPSVESPRFLGLRSSEISLLKIEPQKRSTNVVRGRVCHGRYLGDEMLWTVQTETGQLWKVSQTASRTAERGETVADGDEVFLEWNLDSGVLVS